MSEEETMAEQAQRLLEENPKGQNLIVAKPDGSLAVFDVTTMRDRFAMAALTGIVSRADHAANSLATARYAYGYADAMLEARGKSDG